jgi:hypothetical protein
MKAQKKCDLDYTSRVAPRLSWDARHVRMPPTRTAQTMLRGLIAIGIVLLAVMTANAQTAPLASSPALQAGDAEALAAGLVRTMRLNAERTERLDEPGDAIRAYIKAGYVRLKPELREEYTDYRVMRLPAKLFGQELLVVEEEYLTKFIGCCVNEGVGVILRVTADLAPLKEFAAANGCSLRNDRTDIVATLQKLKVKPVEGELVAMSCRTRDMMDR